MTELTDVYISDAWQFATLEEVVDRFDLSSDLEDTPKLDEEQGGYTSEYFEKLTSLLNDMDLKLYGGWIDWWLVVEVGCDA